MSQIDTLLQNLLKVEGGYVANPLCQLEEVRPAHSPASRPRQTSTAEGASSP